MGARAEVVEYWDREIARWVSGDHQLSPELAEWKRAYEGRGHGAIDLTVFPELYGGLLKDGSPKLVSLGLNPGAADPYFQGIDGVFTKQIRASSYSEWTATAPYNSAEWESVKGVNVYGRNRLAFARRLFEDPELPLTSMVGMELYPFHSTGVTAPIAPPAHLLERFVFAPLAEIDVEHIFAFGKPWHGMAGRLGLGVGRSLSIAWKTPSREARVYPLDSGQSLVVMSQRGYAGPPGAEDTEKLRRALGY